MMNTTQTIEQKLQPVLITDTEFETDTDSDYETSSDEDTLDCPKLIYYFSEKNIYLVDNKKIIYLFQNGSEKKQIFNLLEHLETNQNGETYLKLTTRKYLNNENPYLIYYVGVYFNNNLVSYKKKINLYDNEINIVDDILVNHNSYFKTNVDVYDSDSDSEIYTSSDSDSD